MAGPGVLSLIVFAYALTRVEADAAGRGFAAYGGVYIVASLVWLKVVEGVAPDRWEILGGGADLPHRRWTNLVGTKPQVTLALHPISAPRPVERLRLACLPPSIPESHLPGGGTALPARAAPPLPRRRVHIRVRGNRPRLRAREAIRQAGQRVPTGKC